MQYATGRTGAKALWVQGAGGDRDVRHPEHTDRLRRRHGRRWSGAFPDVRCQNAGPAPVTHTYESTGKQALYRGPTGGGTQLPSTAATYPATTWSYIGGEGGAGRSSTATSTAQVWVDRALRDRLRRKPRVRRRGALTQIAWTGSGSWDQTIDDLYLVDLTGPYPFNDRLGNVKVEQLLPSAAGATTQWTPSTGANWAAVDEQPPSSTDYVGSTTSGQRDLYATTDLVSTTGTVLAVRPAWFIAKSDAGAEPGVRGVLRGGDGTVKAQATQAALTAVYVNQHRCPGTDPTPTAHPGRSRT